MKEFFLAIADWLSALTSDAFVFLYKTDPFLASLIIYYTLGLATFKIIAVPLLNFFNSKNTNKTNLEIMKEKTKQLQLEKEREEKSRGN